VRDQGGLLAERPIAFSERMDLAIVRKEKAFEALIDTLALDGGMERMRDVMHQPDLRR
jgi:hypothetical protein